MPSINWIDAEDVKLLRLYNYYIIGRSQQAPIDDVEPGLPTLLEAEEHVWQIPVKEKICNSRSNGAFFRDEMLPTYQLYVREVLNQAQNYWTDWCPQNVFWHAKIGTGCSRLKELAPLCYGWLIKELQNRYGY